MYVSLALISTATTIIVGLSPDKHSNYNNRRPKPINDRKMIVRYALIGFENTTTLVTNYLMIHNVRSQSLLYNFFVLYIIPLIIYYHNICIIVRKTSVQ